ncbi:AAA family ATPase [Bacillus cereus]|uniref:AAA family ATPase n=1 Tax=Bacillus cereus TaxID=1396 RepID=UPI000BF9DAFE|nr:SMC family ATPase [Bacillus cereus]PFW02686.1 hypothetical protein COL12_29670 [Bacillus cereus]
MKITSLSLQAFRGFNKKEEFCFESTDIIVLYGPNGHGKSSIFDAIEWVLTGGIYRFDVSSPERRRTRFVRNLHSDISDKTYVKLGIILLDERRFFIERECIVSTSDRTDYGKYKLRIFDENNQLYKDGEAAENILKRWLINEDWLSKIGSPTTMLSLTHILSQEKIAEFLRGMQERDRYDAMSLIFGTDHFEKYREGFRNVRNSLNSELDQLSGEIRERKLLRDNLKSEVNELELKVGDNEDKEFNVELENYLKSYPEIREYKDDLRKLIKSIVSNLQDNQVERKKLQNEYHLLKEIQDEIPNLGYIRKAQKNVLYEQQQLENFKQLYMYKLKIEQLLSTTNEISDDRVNMNSLTNQQTESNLKFDLLLEQKEKALAVIETINIQLATLSWENEIGFLIDIKSKVTEKEYEYLKNEFEGMSEKHQFIEKKKSIQQIELIKIADLDRTLEKIKSTNEMYSAFLTSLKQYISNTPEELNGCPACGTKNMKKFDILSNIEKQQLRVNENLPELENLYCQVQDSLKNISEDINSAKYQLEEHKKNIRELLGKINENIKKTDITIEFEKQKQLTVQQKIDSIKLKLNQFEEECILIGVNIRDNIKEQLEFKTEKLLIDLRESLQDLSELKSGYLPNELTLETVNILQIDECVQTLHKIATIQETEINRISRLVKLSETINLDIKKANLVKLKSDLVNQTNSLENRLNKVAELETISIKLQSMIEFNTEKMRLIQLQKNLDEMNKKIIELENQEIEMNKDSEYLYELMNKSNEAISNLNKKVFKQLKETIQAIFEQINSHPIFTKLDLVKDTYRNNNCLTINVSRTDGSSEIRANAPYVFSSAQVNSIALSIFLALALKQKWSSLQLIGMDDPIQSMDEVNIISFIDLMRLFVDKHKKQVIISTHDYSFYKMILKKFRYFNLKTIEYETYGDKGPSIKKHNADIPYNKVELELTYEQARDALLQLDKNE